jgi:hypothetical protein
LVGSPAVRGGWLDRLLDLRDPATCCCYYATPSTVSTGPLPETNDRLLPSSSSSIGGGRTVSTFGRCTHLQI